MSRFQKFLPTAIPVVLVIVGLSVARMNRTRSFNLSRTLLQCSHELWPYRTICTIRLGRGSRGILAYLCHSIDVCSRTLGGTPPRSVDARFKRTKRKDAIMNQILY